MHYANVILFGKRSAYEPELTYSVPDSMSVEIGQFVWATFKGRKIVGVATSLSPDPPASLDTSKILPLIDTSPTRLPKHTIDTARFVSSYYHSPLSHALRLCVPKSIWDGSIDPPIRRFASLFLNPLPSVRGTKARRILEVLAASGGSLPLEGLSETVGGFTRNTLMRLKQLGAVSIRDELRFSPFALSSNPFTDPIHTLTPAQAHALGSIRQTQLPSLLFGVTASGKTELYLHLIRDTIAQGKQAILLVPEIALTPQAVAYFRHLLGDRVAFIHSKLSDGERAQEWWKAYSGYAPLMIGSRSALFAPYPNLGLVILDEEHEWTYKQESDPYYRAHQVAEKLSRDWGVKVVFGSATPSAESWSKARAGEYTLAELPSRVTGVQPPLVHVADLREEFKKGNFGIFSLRLANLIRDRLDKGEQTILFVNQRGLANAVVCRDCGHTEKCPRCDIALKYHRVLQARNAKHEIRNHIQIPNPRFQIQNRDRLVCHYCQFSKAPELVCPECRSPHIRHIGVGTQRVEEEVKRMFPNARVIRADKDTTDDKAGFEPIYRDFSDRKFDILVGTQMIAKGLDFANVSLIGIVLADVGLHQPDFRSSERLFQILTQVSGRCGRRDGRGEVVLQTYNPTHPAIQFAARQDYLGFMDRELGFRSKLGYPPFERMVKFTVVGLDAHKLAKHIQTEHDTLEDIAAANELDLKFASAPSSVPRIAGRYHYHVIVRSKNPEILFAHWRPPNGWRIDVDPVHTA